MYKLIKLFSQNRFTAHCLARLWLFLPRQFSVWVCKLFAKLLIIFAPELKNKVITNFQEIFPNEYPGNEVKAICQEYFQNLFLTIFEILIYSREINTLDHYLEVEGENHMLEALKQGRGVILYAPHVGNFFYYYYHLSQHYPSLTVATALDEQLHNIYLIFHRLGCLGLDYDSTNKWELLTKLKKHLAQNGVLLLMGDFWRQEFPPTMMFGRSTRLPRGAAALALDLKVPVVPFYGFRMKGFYHKIVFQEPIYLSDHYLKNQKAEATSYLNGFLEKIIKKVPTQWFYWFNCDERWENNSQLEPAQIKRNANYKT